MSASARQSTAAAATTDRFIGFVLTLFARYGPPGPPRVRPKAAKKHLTPALGLVQRQKMQKIDARENADRLPRLADDDHRGVLAEHLFERRDRRRDADDGDVPR